MFVVSVSEINGEKIKEKPFERGKFGWVLVDEAGSEQEYVVLTLTNSTFNEEQDE